jgi:hypothetical protein
MARSQVRSRDGAHDWNQDIFEMLGLRKGDFVAQFWRAFVDDSADEKREEFILAGCIFGPKDRWSSFNKVWRKTLHAAPRIEHFHGKELRRLDGQFTLFRDPVKYPKPTGSVAANAKRDTLRSVIESSALALCGVGVLVPEYRRVRNTHPRGPECLAQDPFEYVLQEVMQTVTFGVVQRDPQIKFAFIFDQGSKMETYAKIYANWREKNPQTAKSVKSFGWDDDEAVYGLQAADMAASSVKVCYEDRDKDEEPPLELAFWRIQIQRETNLVKMLDTQP